MSVTKIDHIGVAVKNIDEAKKIYEDYLGLLQAGLEEIPDQKVKVAFFPTGESKIELLEATEDDSPVAKFIAARGEGVHHIALRVENLEKVLRVLKERGVRLIDNEPRYGAGGAKIAFLHPKSTNGVLIELCQRKEEG